MSEFSKMAKRELLDLREKCEHAIAHLQSEIESCSALIKKREAENLQDRRAIATWRLMLQDEKGLLDSIKVRLRDYPNNDISGDTI